MALKTTKFDPAAYLKTEEEMAAFLSEAFAIGDAAFVADAIGVIARAKGMSAVAKHTNLSRENLYRSLSKGGNPELDTVLKVVHAVGLRLTASTAGSKARRRRTAVGQRKRKAA